MVKIKVGGTVCWSFGGRHSQYYPKKNNLCGRVKDLNPLIAPSSYKVKLDKKSIKLLKELDNVSKVDPIMYPVREAIKRSR